MTEKLTCKELKQKVKQLEKTTREHQRFRDIIKSLPQIVFEIDKQGMLTYINQDAFRYFGYTEKEFDKKFNALQMLIPEDRDRAEKNIHKVLNGEVLGGVEYMALRKDGTTFPVKIHAKTFFQGSKPGGLRGIIIDLQGSKKAEDELRESEYKLFTHLQNTPIGAISWDLNLNTIDWNPAAEKIFGYTREEVMGIHVKDLILPEDKKKLVAEIFKDLLSDKGGSRSTNENITKDGTRITCDWFNTTIKDVKGNVVGVTSVVQDITKRIQTEKALKESEERYRSMMEAIIDPTYICSHDFRIEYMNPAMIDRIGRNAYGEKCHKALYDMDEQCSWCVFDKIQSEKHAAYEIKDPKTGCHYLVSASTVAHSDVPVSNLSILRDITDIKMMEKQRILAETKLQQALKMESIGTLAGGIAHDFNNILSSVIGYTELAIDNAGDNTVLADHLKEVYTAGMRAKELVKQILTFARQTGEEIRPVQVNIIVKEALKLLRSSLPTSIEIKQEIESDSLIMGDPTQVHQILMNLCTNAAQAMEEDGGVLSVGLKDVRLDVKFTKPYKDLNPGDYIKLFVSDTGSGIAPEIIKSIFEPYFTTKAPGEGTGMGLATAHGIVKKLSGEIMVESEVEKGSIFTVYFPIERKRRDEKPYKAEAIPTGNEQILLIDDELPIARMMGLMIEKLGYNVVVRTSSIEALELFRSKPADFDLVITDMTMPNMTGDKLAAEMIAVKPDIAVIICTGYSKKVSEESTRDIGIKAIVYKPVVKTDLAKTIRKVLDHDRRKQDELQT
jgi:PAS domain S-box-containing protein